ncbi:HD domain-containing protein [Bowmanella pacifica]|uniref:HD domain-containing protein n=1 Tax=Bowmanella pacifica TaxID=502051 RepID=A0A918DKK2_9ALTE|nr:HD domain-containing protein [Bowmanella pacifica]GGO71998.1 hypothetical protein GCM10010982_29080 [Bowmanella pacifica]
MLSFPDKVQLFGLLLKAKCIEQHSALLIRLGFRPVLSEVDDHWLCMPDSQLVRQVEQEAAALYTQPLLAHCYRTYFFAQLFARYHKLKVDSELLAVSSLLHDIGLCSPHSAQCSNTGFQVIGARYTQQRLAQAGYDTARQRRAYESISLHLNPHIKPEQPWAEAAVLQRGATLDVIGANRHLFAQDLLVGVHKYHPRHGFKQEIVGTMHKLPHHPNCHAGFLGKCGFAQLAICNPLDAS